MIEHIILIVPIFILTMFIIIFTYATIHDFKKPPEPSVYVWRHIYPDYKGDWDRGKVTNVYCNVKTNDIRGKVVKTDEGLYLATMWNGQYKEFLYEHEAIKSVEEYKPRVHK